jgi:pimeloyl-ACP methyl ester carboxylesterase
VARMKAANQRLSDEVARHLTLHGTNWNADGSMTWKFDNYVHAFSPYGHEIAHQAEVFGQITCPALLFWGLESFAPVPETDPRRLAIPNCRMVTVPNAGHWLHHDQLDLFLRETVAFLKD